MRASYLSMAFLKPATVLINKPGKGRGKGMSFAGAWIDLVYKTATGSWKISHNNRPVPIRPEPYALRVIHAAFWPWYCAGLPVAGVYFYAPLCHHECMGAEKC